MAAEGFAIHSALTFFLTHALSCRVSASVHSRVPFRSPQLLRLQEVAHARGVFIEVDFPLADVMERYGFDPGDLVLENKVGATIKKSPHPVCELPE